MRFRLKGVNSWRCIMAPPHRTDTRAYTSLRGTRFPVSIDNKHLTGCGTSNSHQQRIKIISRTFTRTSSQLPISGFIILAIALPLCMYIWFYATVSPYFHPRRITFLSLASGTHTGSARWISREASKSTENLKTPDRLSWDASLKAVEAICIWLGKGACASVRMREREREREREWGDDLQDMHFLSAGIRSKHDLVHEILAVCIMRMNFVFARKADIATKERRFVFVFTAQCDRPNFPFAITLDAWDSRRNNVNAKRSMRLKCLRKLQVTEIIVNKVYTSRDPRFAKLRAIFSDKT